MKTAKNTEIPYVLICPQCLDAAREFPAKYEPDSILVCVHCREERKQKEYPCRVKKLLTTHDLYQLNTQTIKDKAKEYYGVGTIQLAESTAEVLTVKDLIAVGVDPYQLEVIIDSARAGVNFYWKDKNHPLVLCNTVRGYFVRDLTNDPPTHKALLGGSFDACDFYIDLPGLIPTPNWEPEKSFYEQQLDTINFQSGLVTVHFLGANNERACHMLNTEYAQAIVERLTAEFNLKPVKDQ